MNRNVTLTFVLRVCDALAQGVWNMAVLSNYIAMLAPPGHDKTYVGYAQALQGGCEAALAIPAGWLAGRMRRDRLLRVAGVLAFIAIAMTSSVTFVPQQYKYPVLCVAVAVWGFQQANGPVLDALFADSVRTGGRSGLYTALFAWMLVSFGLGPMLGAGLMYAYGNTWTIKSLELTLLVGMGMALAPAIVLFFFDDTRALGEESEGVLKRAGGGASVPAEQEPLLPNDHLAPAESSPNSNAAEPATPAVEIGESEGGGPVVASHAIAFHPESAAGGGTAANGAAGGHGTAANGTAGSEAQQAALPEVAVKVECPQPEAAAAGGAAAGGAEDAAQPEPHNRRCCCLGVSSVPILLVVTDVVYGLASGMTIKFFPLFFKDEVGLAPFQLNMMFGLTPWLLAPCSVLAGWLARNGLGRIQTLLLFQVCGISLMFVIAFHKEIWTVPSIVVPLFMIRTVLMNSCGPLRQSVLMDYAPKGQRGIWSSIGSVAVFGWSGSAAFGGWLIQRYEFGATFGITASMQVFGSLLLLPLLGLVPRSEEALASAIKQQAPVEAGSAAPPPAGAQPPQAAEPGAGEPSGDNGTAAV